MVFNQEHADQADALCRGTLVEHLGIRFGVDADGRLTADLPVDDRTLQPAGLLHGGATAALAESLGSMGSALLIDLDRQGVVGIEVNANHLKGVRNGHVRATGVLVHQGRTTHVWDIRVTDGHGALCAICRLTNLIIERR